MVVLYDLFSVDFKHISAWVRVVASDYGDVEGSGAGEWWAGPTLQLLYRIIVGLVSGVGFH